MDIKLIAHSPNFNNIAYLSKTKAKWELHVINTKFDVKSHTVTTIVDLQKELDKDKESKKEENEIN
jgi:hypothetical protein